MCPWEGLSLSTALMVWITCGHRHEERDRSSITPLLTSYGAGHWQQTTRDEKSVSFTHKSRDPKLRGAALAAHFSVPSPSIYLPSPFKTSSFSSWLTAPWKAGPRHHHYGHFFPHMDGECSHGECVRGRRMKKYILTLLVTDTACRLERCRLWLGLNGSDCFHFFAKGAGESS